MDNPGGMNSWSVAFHTMLEGILRDAEDMAITIQYHAIRRHFRRLAHYLDDVRVARLVVLDATCNSNITTEKIRPGQKARPKHITLLYLLDGADDSEGNKAEWTSTQEAAPDIFMTDLRNWSDCIFGDPLMAVVFGDKPSRQLLSGFHGTAREGPLDCSADGDDPPHAPVDEDIAGFEEEAHMRLLLYQCYHATVAVVKEFYRPLSGSTNREFAARRRLNAVLARLNEMERVSKNLHARPGDEMSPAKRPRIEEY